MGVYVKDKSNGGFEYRRRVPGDVVNAIGKREFKKSLGTTRADAVRSYPKIHDQFERHIEDARRLSLLREKALQGDLGKLALT